MRSNTSVWRCPIIALNICTVLMSMFFATALAADRSTIDRTRSTIQSIKKYPFATRKIPTVTAPVLKSVQLWDIVNGATNSRISYRQRVRLGLRYAGTRPTHYRVSENSRFDRASWQTFHPRARYSYTFQRNTDGRKTVYTQLRYGTGTKYLSQVRLFTSAQNAFTFTEYNGMDPEVGYGVENGSSGVDVGYYPRPRTFLVGLNVKF